MDLTTIRNRWMVVASALLANSLLLGAVRRVELPEKGVSPEVAVGSSGKVHLVFARDGNAFFAASTDGGETFSRPVRLDPVAGTVLAGHERGPTVAVGKNETVHVIWMSSRSDQLAYTRSAWHGRDFSPPRNLLDAETHLDGATVAAGEEGDVLAAWLDSRLPADPQNPLSLPIFFAKSQDNGKTFSKNQPAGWHGLVRACSCCALKAVAGPGAAFEIAFRSAFHNIRDPFLAEFAFRSIRPAFRLEKIHDDGWELNGCPMSGPYIARGLLPREIWARG